MSAQNNLDDGQVNYFQLLHDYVHAAGDDWKAVWELEHPLVLEALGYIIPEWPWASEKAAKKTPVPLLSQPLSKFAYFFLKELRPFASRFSKSQSQHAQGTPNLHQQSLTQVEGYCLCIIESIYIPLQERNHSGLLRPELVNIIDKTLKGTISKLRQHMRKSESDLEAMAEECRQSHGIFALLLANPRNRNERMEALLGRYLEADDCNMEVANGIYEETLRCRKEGDADRMLAPPEPTKKEKKLEQVATSKLAEWMAMRAFFGYAC
ncbi:hypothetical protein BJ508DRAFT_310402 [Ascobolus immersus RN42]|uniref:Uncharacterized protein n=1 Tax=Ascobolus immersus RN42 TaxID=1160509 RepID=A0A3N4HYW0_ASCIM|nr:hypothetical protein BJ508DRAFT_310402 [Ascobolus immersus RN42]